MRQRSPADSLTDAAPPVGPARALGAGRRRGGDSEPRIWSRSPLPWSGVRSGRIGADVRSRWRAIAHRPFEYYFGATGGGLFKTTDGGSTWTPVTDGQVGSASVGAVAMAPSDPDIVYIGMGEVQLRANVLQGDGVYRSDDAGKSWRHLGLANTRAIGRIRIHPTDPDRVYVAALGHPFGPNPERGVFRTTDGGRTWEKVLFRDERTGAVDLVMDPSDPDILYATLWQVYRKPWRLWRRRRGIGDLQVRRWRRHMERTHAQPGTPRRDVGQDHGHRIGRGPEPRVGERRGRAGRAVQVRRRRRVVGIRQRPSGHLATRVLLPAPRGGSGRPQHAVHPQLPAHALDGRRTHARERARVPRRPSRPVDRPHEPAAHDQRQRRGRRGHGERGSYVDLDAVSDGPDLSPGHDRGLPLPRVWRAAGQHDRVRVVRAEPSPGPEGREHGMDVPGGREARAATSRHTPPTPTSFTRARRTRSPATTERPAWRRTSSRGRASRWASRRGTCPSAGTGPTRSRWRRRRPMRCTWDRSTCGNRSTRVRRGRRSART